MDGGGSQGEDDLPPPPSSASFGTKRIKLHRKPIDQHVVGNSSIPRKLRSAMNKRSRGVVSPPSKKLCHLLKETELSHLKKLKKNKKVGDGSNCSASQATNGPITKDEEEVVEALNSLASMFADNKPVKDTFTSEAERMEGSKSTAMVNISVGETARHNSLSKSSVLEQRNVSGGQKFNLDLDLSTAQENPEKVPLASRSDHTCDMPSGDAAKLRVSSQLCHGSDGTGLPRSVPHTSDHHEHKQLNGLYPVTFIAAEHDHLQPIKNAQQSSRHSAYIEGNLALWPALSTMNNSDVHGLLTRSSTGMAGLGSTGNYLATEKVHPASSQSRKSWKRCATHVYISYLIQAYRTTENNKARWPVPSYQLKLNEIPGLGITRTNDVKVDGLNRVFSAFSMNGMHGVFPVGDGMRNPDEMPGKIIQDQRQQQDQQTSKTSGNCSLQKQSCDFLSLSVDGGGDGSVSKAFNDKTNQRGGGDSAVQLHGPNLHLITQNQSPMPFSLPNTWYSSLHPSLLKVPEGHQLQVPQYHGGPQHTGHAGSAKQQQPHPTWATQLAFQYGTEGIISNVSKWQNGRDEASASHGTQPASLQSMDFVGTKFPSRPQHLLVSPASSSMGQRQQHHLYSGYDDVGIRSHYNGASHMQLFRNTEQLLPR
ncbi:hypothetical protein IFM89_005743 [Coptis chinensis]|uniref:Uncharacterized protein n=1 Tax=Coptis chinensis TaxID=261450 RepID=A0A835IL41_9MAGN|nr:hypothetical protein IFM89_005743 [Coptis chinensis]